MATQTLNVRGMHCGSCGSLVDDALEELPGVRASATKVRKGRTTVDYDPAVTGVADMVRAITQLGYMAEPV
ncbi:MAG: heavy-metal-associated domain-containing protein [Acidimicrobiales bacterium]